MVNFSRHVVDVKLGVAGTTPLLKILTTGMLHGILTSLCITNYGGLDQSWHPGTRQETRFSVTQSN